MQRCSPDYELVCKLFPNLDHLPSRHSKIIGRGGTNQGWKFISFMIRTPSCRTGMYSIVYASEIDGKEITAGEGNKQFH